MKECLIVHYYLSDYFDEYILNNCIDSVSKFDLDIFLISHSPVPEKIQKKVKYFIYDSDDDMVTFDDSLYNDALIYTSPRFQDGNLLVAPFLFSTKEFSYSFYKAVYDIYKIVVEFGYDYSYYFVGDFEINEQEIDKLRKIPKVLMDENKKGYFEKSSSLNLINVFFWYVDNKWLLKNFFFDLKDKISFLKDLKKYNFYCNYDMLITYQAQKNEKDIIINKVDYWGHPVSEERSDLSKKKKSKYIFNSDIGIFYKDDIPHIFCFDFNSEKRKWILYLDYNNGEIYKYNTGVDDYNTWKMFPINIKQFPFNMKCVNEKTNEIYFDVNISDFDVLKNFVITNL